MPDGRAMTRTAMRMQTLHPAWQCSARLEGEACSSPDALCQLLLLHRYLKLLKQGLDPKDAGQGLFYSYNTNLTLSEQRSSQQSADPPSKLAWQQAEPRYFWNRHLAAPLTGASLLAALSFSLCCLYCTLTLSAACLCWLIPV